MGTIDRIKLRLGISDNTQDDLLNDLITEGEQRLRLYLNYKESDNLEPFTATLIKIVVMLHKQEKVYEQMIQQGKDVKSESYSEGSVSQSVTYMTSGDYQEQIEGFNQQIEKYLDEIARYRKVYVKNRNQH